MHIVYVKHYLSDEGRYFFQQTWFPRVKAIISQQAGYIAADHILHQDKDDCVNVILKFNDEASFLQWVDQPEHDKVIQELDSLRSRDYFEYAIATEEGVNVAWEKVTIS